MQVNSHWQLNVCLDDFLVLYIMYTLYYISNDGKGIESVMGRTGQDMMWQIEWLYVYMRLLGALNTS